MKITCSPSLQGLEEHRSIRNNNKDITTIRQNNYLKNIREDLAEEESPSGSQHNNQIIFITAALQGVITDVMIDTGANVSLIDRVEYNRIKEIYKKNIPKLPINNMVIIGATGRPNKTVRQQVMLEVSSEGNMIPMVFLVAQGLPFKAMLGCDTLRHHSAVIDMDRGKITLYHEQGEWSSEIIGRKCATHSRHSFTLIHDNRTEYKTPVEESAYTKDKAWEKKLQEIYSFKATSTSEVTSEQKSQLVSIYNKYKKVFSDLPRQAKDFICELSFNQPINFNRKSYHSITKTSGKKRNTEDDGAGYHRIQFIPIHQSNSGN